MNKILVLKEQTIMMALIAGWMIKRVLWTMPCALFTKQSQEQRDADLELERELGLHQTKDRRNERGKDIPPDGRTILRSKIKGKDARDTKKEITALWAATVTGEQFKKALEDMGFLVGRGKRAAFVIHDPVADIDYNLTRMIEGATTKDVRDRFKGVTLLKYDELKKEQEKVAEAIRAEEERKQKEGQKEEDRKDAAGKAEEERKKRIGEEQRKEAEAQLEKQKELYREAEKVEAQLSEKQTLEEHFRLFEAQRQDTAELHKLRRKPTDRLEIKEAHNRYLENLPGNYDPKNHFGYLINAAANESKAYHREREALNAQIAQTTDPLEREKLSMKRDILHFEYMALTDRRIAGQSEIITGKLNSPEALKHRSRADNFERMAKESREAYRILSKAQEQAKEPPKQEPKQETKKLGLRCETREPGFPPSNFERVSDYVNKIEGQPKGESPGACC